MEEVNAFGPVYNSGGLIHLSLKWRSILRRSHIGIEDRDEAEGRPDANIYFQSFCPPKRIVQLTACYTVSRDFNSSLGKGKF